MVEPSDYGVRIRMVRRAERISSPEFRARVGLIFVATLAGLVLMGLNSLPLWVLLYGLGIATEKAALHLWPAARSRGFFYALVGMNLYTGTVYAVLPVYLWHHDNDALKFGAMAALAGGVLHVYLVRARVWEIAAAHMIPTCAAFLAIALSYYQAPAGGPAFYSALVAAAAVIGYFFIAVYEANVAHRKLVETRSQLYQAQKMEAVGALAGGIAHDFNNLLSVIQGNLELLQQSGEAADRDLFTAEALQACWRGAALTRQLMALGRSSSPLSPPRRVLPETVLADVETLVRRVVPSSIGVRRDAPPDLPAIMVDETALQSALLNLAINARDAMPKGGQMTFSAARVPLGAARPAFLDRQEFVALTVADTGEGIPDAHIKRIFDAFYTTKPKGKGTGLGLAMVAGFARRAGGHVEATSKPGEGARFTLYFPAAGPADSREHRTPDSARAPAPANSDGPLHAPDRPSLTAEPPLPAACPARNRF